MKILLIGPQGSGKSTQAKLLSEYLKVPLISTGEIFRAMEVVRNILEEGKLVDDKATSEIVKNRLTKPDCQKGFILDGYPRNVAQRGLFDPQFDKVVYLNVPDEELMKRLMMRGRADDTLETIKTRLDLYHEQTKPLLNYYQSQKILIEIYGMGGIEEIQGRIREVFNGGN